MYGWASAGHALQNTKRSQTRAIGCVAIPFGGLGLRVRAGLGAYPAAYSPSVRWVPRGEDLVIFTEPSTPAWRAASAIS